MGDPEFCHSHRFLKWSKISYPWLSSLGRVWESLGEFEMSISVHFGPFRSILVHFGPFRSIPVISRTRELFVTYATPFFENFLFE